MIFKEFCTTDCTLTLTPLAKGRVKNGHVRNGHNLSNIKNVCDIDMDEYIAVGIHEAQPTSSKKDDMLCRSNIEKDNINKRNPTSNTDIRYLLEKMNNVFEIVLNTLSVFINCNCFCRNHLKLLIWYHKSLLS